jgi:hypothetical protein
MHGLGVAKRQACLYGLLVGSDNLVPYQIMAEDDILQPMRKRLADFWQNNVLAKVPPDPVVMKDIYRLLRIKNDTEVQANAEIITLLRDLAAQKEIAKAAGEHVDDLQFKIGLQVLGAEAMETKVIERKHRIMHGKETMLTIALQSRTSIDSKLLLDLYPEAHKDCQKVSTFFVFRPKRGK